jgi:alkylated DNA repair dioxygenase AlkB
VLTAAVAGLDHVAAYLNGPDQDELLAVIDGMPWQTDLARRVQHYGYRYDYARRRVQADAYLGPLPDWADRLADQLRADGHAPPQLNQLIVNEYLPGQGIAPHVDCIPCFGDTVVSVSLGSACLMTLSHPAQGTRIDLPLEPGSLLVFRGPARYEWRHGIAARKTDRYDGRTHRRTRRVSLTFRSVLQRA